MNYGSYWRAAKYVGKTIDPTRVTPQKHVDAKNVEREREEEKEKENEEFA